jgi:hypothetical protein
MRFLNIAKLAITIRAIPRGNRRFWPLIRGSKPANPSQSPETAFSMSE